jgi:hypothetical protein
MSFSRVRRVVAVVLVSVVAGCASQADSSPSALDTADTSSPTATSAASASGNATTSSASPGASTETFASPSANASQRIDVPGGPLGLDVSEGHAWVVATDAGELVDIDLASGTSTKLTIGSSANWVKVLGPGRLVLSRFATEPKRATLELLEMPGGDVTPVFKEPIDALDLDGDTIWAFEKKGTVLRIDQDGRILGRVPVKIAANEHIDVVGFEDSAFASSDSTAVRRVGGDPLKVDATIETDGGVPFVRDGPLVWGARPDEVWAIDAATDEVTLRIPLADVAEILDLDVDGDDAWIAVRHPGQVGAVIRVDLTTGEEIGDVPVGLPAQVVIDGAKVWVTDYDSNALLGFDR